jgi:hypothetical protein
MASTVNSLKSKTRSICSMLQITTFHSARQGKQLHPKMMHLIKMTYPVFFSSLFSRY